MYNNKLKFYFKLQQQTKRLILECIRDNKSAKLIFIMQILTIIFNENYCIAFLENLRDICSRQLTQPYMLKKLKVLDIQVISQILRKKILKKLSLHKQIQVTEIFVNNMKTMYRQGLVVSRLCRLQTIVKEVDTLHIVSCKYNIFEQFYPKVPDSLQLKSLLLVPGDTILILLVDAR